MSHPAAPGPVTSGIVAAVVGYASTFVIVLAGLTAVGASPAQAASGLVTLCVTQALTGLWMSIRYRVPVLIAWSTPGAALLASASGIAGGWPAAVAAFLATGALFVLTALVPKLGDLVASIPSALAQAMLAGILLPLCLAPVTALVDSPAVVAPVVITWLALLRLAPRWSVPGALVVALIVIGGTAGGSLAEIGVLPALEWTAPRPSAEALIGLAVPLYVVTMASQNVPGAAIISSYGHRVPWRPSLAATGVGTAAGAFTGGHAINLAAITSALTAGPEAGPDPSRRWTAVVSACLTYLVLALASTVLTALVAAAPDGILQAAAGLALLGTLAGAVSSALSEPRDRTPAVVTLLIAASGVTVLGVGAAFWALVCGLLTYAVLRLGTAALRDASPRG
jgi:benzoate membrane transport protein